ncbi:MAG: hypothetical protein GXP53_14155 [Deltaproteobacteria bacterium]|nr:hypothetical protein [Deltaproteobacteria bacterium]
MKTNHNYIISNSKDLIDDVADIAIDNFRDKDRQFSSGKGKGVQMKNWKPFTDFVLNKLVNKAEIINGEALLPADGRPVVAIASHGPGVAWMPLAALAGKFFINNGYGDIIGGIYPHKALFLIPGLKGYYKRVLGTPTEVNTVDGIVDLLKNHEIGLTGTAPEGANCLLSFNDYVAPFRSKGMIAAAIKADAGICLMAHQGAESWNIRVNLPLGLNIPFTNGVKGVNIPLPPYRKIRHYIVLCKRYEPSITSNDLKNRTKRQSRFLINIEVEKIRAEMNRMTDEVRDLMKEKTVKFKAAKQQKANTWQKKVLQIQSRLFPADEAYG